MLWMRGQGKPFSTIAPGRGQSTRVTYNVARPRRWRDRFPYFFFQPSRTDWYTPPWATLEFCAHVQPEKLPYYRHPYHSAAP